ncbi:MAG TPA: LptA/OstA family protein [Bryobacteraceae bacterium]|nr:LptA/OstA family protein [Bryobacteraceae bacterium]
MLRRARWLLLLAILLIAGTVSAVFVAQRGEQRRARPLLSAPLEPGTSATAEDWQYEIKDGDRPKARIRAKEFRQVKEPSAFLLNGLEMRLYGPDPATYDLIRSARASFDTADGLMYSEGDVEITMGVRADGSGGGRPVKIRASGVSYDARTSRVWTERHAEFELEGAEGESTGASYDPMTRELRMEKDAVVLWHSQPESGKTPMRVESGQLVYVEGSGEVHLMPWSRLFRGTLRMDAGAATVTLKEGQLDRVDAADAKGVDESPGRHTEYAANQLTVHFTPKGEIREVAGEGSARLASRTKTGVTQVTAPSVLMNFAEGASGSELSRALASGGARVENVPPAPAPRRLLTSQVIEMTMRPGGQEIAQVVTHTPGQVDFVPVRPEDKRRRLNAERLTMLYAAGNVLENFRAVEQVRTHTESPRPKLPPKVAVTRSKDLLAQFNPKTGQMTIMEQWNGFEYEEDGRQARADRARLDQADDRITLLKNARVWDETGSTEAEQIVIEQKTGEMTATGGVTSTRRPDPKAKPGGLVNAGQTLRARARQMRVTNQNREIEYEGEALLWQGENRLRAPVIRIDRQQNTLAAEGGVISSLPVDGRGMATIRSRTLFYNDAQKLATYTGAAALNRPGLDLKGETLKLWFVDEPSKEGGTQTQLDRLFADGAAEVVEKSPERTRTGKGEHLEYYARDEKMVLTGGNPLVQDSQRGISRGAVITWFSRQDRLIIDNTGAGPAVSVVQKEQKKP